MHIRQVEDADTDIAADMDILTGVFQDMTDQGRGRRLAVGAGDRHGARPLVRRQAGERAGKQFDITKHRNMRRMRQFDRPVRRWVRERNAWRQDKRGELRPVGSLQVLDGETFLRRRQKVRRLVVPQDRLGATGLQRARGGKP